MEIQSGQKNNNLFEFYALPPADARVLRIAELAPNICLCAVGTGYRLEREDFGRLDALE